MKKDSSNEVEKIIYEEKDNGHQVITISLVKTAALFFILFNAALALPAFMSPAGVAPHRGEAVCLPAPGGF